MHHSKLKRQGTRRAGAIHNICFEKTTRCARRSPNVSPIVFMRISQCTHGVFFKIAMTVRYSYNSPTIFTNSGYFIVNLVLCLAVWTNFSYILFLHCRRMRTCPCRCWHNNGRNHQCTHKHRDDTFLYRKSSLYFSFSAGCICKIRAYTRRFYHAAHGFPLWLTGISPFLYFLQQPLEFSRY